MHLIIKKILLNQKDLSRLDLLLLAFIYSYKNPLFYYSNRKLALYFGVDQSAVSKSLQRLERKNYIAISFEEINNKRRRVIYKTNIKLFWAYMNKRHRGRLLFLALSLLSIKFNYFVGFNLMEGGQMRNPVGFCEICKYFGGVAIQQQQQGTPPPSYGNAKVNKLIEELNKVNGFRLFSKNLRYYASNAVALLTKFDKDGRVKEGRDWLADDFETNLKNLLFLYSEKYVKNGYRFLSFDSFYYKFLKPFIENKGVLMKKQQGGTSFIRFENENLEKYKNLKLNVIYIDNGKS